MLWGMVGIGYGGVYGDVVCGFYVLYVGVMSIWLGGLGVLLCVFVFEWLVVVWCFFLVVVVCVGLLVLIGLGMSLEYIYLLCVL